MDWHARYLQQAAWTSELRAYLFQKTGLSTARRVLEVGCGTGAVLTGLATDAAIHGLDLDRKSLNQCVLNVPCMHPTEGDALQLPYAAQEFNIVFCHFLLLWVKQPVQALVEMKRVVNQGGHILAIAEPDYSRRIDKTKELEFLGRLQTEALRKQGADPAFGAKLAQAFNEAGIQIVETGEIQDQTRMSMATPEEREMEWAVLEVDLQGVIPADQIKQMKATSEEAWGRGERKIHIPTHFAWGRV